MLPSSEEKVKSCSEIVRLTYCQNSQNIFLLCVPCESNPMWTLRLTDEATEEEADDDNEEAEEQAEEEEEEEEDM